MRWIFKAVLGWLVVIVSGLMLHEFVHLVSVGFDYEQFCLVGHDKSTDAVGWVATTHKGINISGAELLANIIGFGLPLLVFALWLRRS